MPVTSNAEAIKHNLRVAIIGGVNEVAKDAVKQIKPLVRQRAYDTGDLMRSFKVVHPAAAKGNSITPAVVGSTGLPDPRGPVNEYGGTWAIAPHNRRMASGKTVRVSSYWMIRTGRRFFRDGLDSALPHLTKRIKARLK